MGTVYIFRGKAASGKSTLANKLGRDLSIPVFCKDDVLDALKKKNYNDNRALTNEICYDVLINIIQRSLNLGSDVILDIGLADKKYAKIFFDRLNFGDNTIVKFFVECKDMKVWKARHEERLKNPLPHQSFKSFDHVLEHYEKMDVNPLNNEYIIDTSMTVDNSYRELLRVLESI